MKKQTENKRIKKLKKIISVVKADPELKKDIEEFTKQK